MAESSSLSEFQVKVGPETLAGQLSSLGVKFETMQDKSGRLNKRGKQETSTLYKTLLGKYDGDINELLEEVEDTRVDLDVELLALRTEIAYGLSQEWKNKGRIYKKGMASEFQSEVRRRFDEDERVRQLKFKKKVLSSISQKGRMQILAPKLRELRESITDADLLEMEAEFKGRGVRVPPEALLRQIAAMRKLRQEQIKEEEAVKEEQSSRLKRMRTKLQEAIVQLEFDLSVYSGLAKDRLGEVIRQVKEKPAHAFLVAVTIAGLTIGGLELCQQISQRDVIISLEKGIPPPVPSKLMTHWGPVLEKGVELPEELSGRQLYKEKKGEKLFEGLLEKIREPRVGRVSIKDLPIQKEPPVSVTSLKPGEEAGGELVAPIPIEQEALTSVLATETTPFPGLEGVRKLICPTVEQLKQLAREGKLYFRNNHPIVIVEPEFLWFWASRPKEIRGELLDRYADGIIKGLIRHFGEGSKVEVFLEAGHMSKVPEGLRNQDTGTAAKLAEGGVINERDVNLELSKIIARKIRERQPGWIIIINSDESGIFINSHVATFDGNPYDVRALDVLMVQRYVWEKLAEAATKAGYKPVKIAVHHNGGANNPRGGEVIPPAVGDFRDESLALAKAINEGLKNNVTPVLKDYETVVIELDQADDPYPITDCAVDDPQAVKEGNLEELHCKANRFVARIIKADRLGVPEYTVVPENNLVPNS